MDKKINTVCPLESLHDTIVFSPKDWGEDETDVWMYGVIVGWQLDTLKSFQKKYGWSDREVDRLRILHRGFLQIKEGRNG